MRATMGEATVGGAMVGDPVAGDTASLPASAIPAPHDDAGSRIEPSPPVIRGGALARFLAWRDTLPFHGWWIFPALAIVTLAWGHALLWLTGQLRFGTFDPTLTVSVAYGPYTLAALAYINLVGGRALAAFWPATGWPEHERRGWTHAFTTIEATLTRPSLALGLVVAAGAFLSAPESVTGADTRSRLIYAAALAPTAMLGYSTVVLAIAHTTRQLRLVIRIHREARAIDPFDRVPVYAFSRFTALIGLLYLVSGYYTVAFNSSFQSGNFIGIGVLATVIGLAAVCFIVPLWGIHGRLVAEKDVLLAGVEVRVTNLGGELYRRIDAGEFDGTKVISEAIAAAGAIRERIARLPTWPWPPQLLRGFLSALLLPVIVYVLSRVIGGRIGA